MDRGLSDDTLKLVRYKVLFVKREHEVAFPDHEVLVAANMDEVDFSAWKIAEFLQELGRCEVAVPHQWQAINFPPMEYVRDGKLRGLPDEEKKYLRVYYEVLDRYPREEIKHYKNQISILEHIRDAIPEKTGAQAKPTGNA